ncbi:MAG: DUF421 domain-containing protein [Gemmatimonadaceae bacterium]
MIDSTMFTHGWHDVIRVLVLGPIGYFALILMLRVSRKRTLAQMNVFDFVYIVVMGEILATTIVSDHVPLLRGLLALALLIGFQVLLSWLTTRSAAVEHFINGKPTLLFHRGRFLRDSMRAQRVTEEEVLAAVRVEGVADLGEVEAVVLETDGEFSVLHVGDAGRDSTLRDVPEARPRAHRDAKHARRATR